MEGVLCERKHQNTKAVVQVIVCESHNSTLRQKYDHVNVTFAPGLFTETLTSADKLRHL